MMRLAVRFTEIRRVTQIVTGFRAETLTIYHFPTSRSLASMTPIRNFCLFNFPKPSLHFQGHSRLRDGMKNAVKWYLA